MAFVVVLACPARGAAQEVTVDAGVALLRFPADDRHVVGPWLRVERAAGDERLRTRLAGSLVASPGVAAGALEGTARWRQPLGRRVAAEVGGEATALSSVDERTSRSVLADARVGRAVGTGGVWAGGSGHLAWREAGALTGHAAAAGAWWRLPATTVAATLVRQWAEGQLFATDRRDRVLAVVPVRYLEGAVEAHLARDGALVDVSAGARRDPDALRRVEPMWSVGATLWGAGRTAVTLAVAHQPDDFVRGADATESFSAGLRVGAHPVPRAPAPVAPATVHVQDAPGAPRRLRVHAAGARSVQVMGDFTGWEPVTLFGSDGDFTLDQPLAPGTRRLVVRVDDGAWRAPANLPAMDDDYGGRVGLLAVAP